MSEFLTKFEEATVPDPEWGHRRVRRLSDAAGEGWAEIVVCDEPPNAIRIESLLAEPERRGTGTRAMEFLCKLADQLEAVLVLEPLPIPRDRSSYSPCVLSNRPAVDLAGVAQLRRWYEKFGFAENLDDSKEMVRQPGARP
jgi:hypothetical protein